MVTVSGKLLRRLKTAAVLSLAVISINCLFNYADNFALAGELSESLDIISGCTPNAVAPLNGPRPIVDSRIPRIVHQIWKTNDVRTYSTKIEASHDSWKEVFEPLNYTVKLWTDDAILHLIRRKYTWILSTYEAYPQNIQRADIARLLIIHAEGGIYADLDVYPTSVDPIHCLQHLGLQAIFAPTANTLGLSNHFFMAERGSPFLQWALYEAKRRGNTASRHILLPYLQVFWSTGPTMVTAALRKYAWLYGTLQHNLGLLDDGYSRTMIRHAAGRSWHGSDGWVLNYIADHARIRILLLSSAFFTVLGLVYVMRRHCGCAMSTVLLTRPELYENFFSSANGF